MSSPAPRLPQTYAECRAQFRCAADEAGVQSISHPISARGPEGEQLAIDVAHIGSSDARTALLVLSGVHGVEGFANSTLQTELLSELADRSLPENLAVVLVHAVNPWGMAHGRRQNESNVDLNRNWRRSDRDPERNVGYDEVHPLACPDVDTVPSMDDLLAVVGPVLAERGEDWVQDAITNGQYAHPDGLHFGGHETEESCRILERVVAEHLPSVGRLLTVDLHTGVGPYGELTLLSNQPSGSDRERFVHDAFGHVDLTIRSESTRSVKSGPIAAGVADLLPSAECVAVTAEFGTASDMDQLIATYQEQWVHRRGDPADPQHAAIRQRYRECFTPEDPEWTSAVLDRGRTFLHAATDAVLGWRT